MLKLHPFPLSIVFAIVLIFSGCGSEELDDTDNFEIGENQNANAGEEEDFDWLVAPTPVEFATDLAPGETAQRTVVVENVGEATLAISEASIVDDEYEVFDEGNGWPDGEELESGETLEFSVQYTPEFLTAYDAEIVLHTDDPDRESDAIDVVAQAPDANLSVSPTEMGFPDVPTGTTDEKTLTVENTGSHTLQIADIILTAGEETYDVAFVDPETGQESDEAPQIIAPGDDPVEVLVYFSPDEVGDVYGTLAIYSNDPTHTEFEVHLSGTGSLPCNPELMAHARAKVGDGDWTDDQLPTPWDAIVDLDGGDSEGPDGVEITHEWTLLADPEQSNAAVASTTAPTTQFDPLVIGSYVVELNVYDEDGLGACEPAQIGLDVIPTSEIHVELTWNVPASDDGTGTDLDLHYLHPNGQWSTEPWGVFWANPNPEWQDQSQVQLTLDSVTGEAPEIVTHDNPASGHDYSVGVSYFGDPHDYGTTVGDVRIFFYGSLAFDDEQPFEYEGGGSGASDGDFWHAADIIVDDGDGFELDAVDEFYEDSGFPD